MKFYLGFDPYSEEHWLTFWEVMSHENVFTDAMKFKIKNDNGDVLSRNDFKSPGTVIQSQLVALEIFNGEATNPKVRKENGFYGSFYDLDDIYDEIENLGLGQG